MVFAGILLAILLSGLSDFVSQKTNLPYGWSVAIVCILILLVVGGLGVLAAPSVADQFDQLVQKIPESLSKIKSQLQQYSWAQSLLESTDPQQAMDKSGGKILFGVSDVLGAVLGGLTSLVVIFFIGIYATVDPGIYQRGFLHLIPRDRRPRIKEVLKEMVETLRWWLIGKFIGMAIIGVLTMVGLWLLDIPLALVLGVIAALLTFIPNIGPILAAIPAILLGLIDSPQQALYIGLLYLGIQMVESYLITPLIQQKTIELPPALILSVQVLMGVLFGALGIALATPLTAATMVATKRLYIEDKLNDSLPSS
jgi:predicted PurR-regulated permease PerM